MLFRSAGKDRAHLQRADPARRGAVLALNSAASYVGALVGAVLLGAAYGEGGFPLVAGLATLCALAAMAVAAARVIRPAGRND